MDADIRRKPGRPPMTDRAVETTREEVVTETRRRRKDAGASYNLAVPAELFYTGAVLDPAQWVARWVNDEKNNLQRYIEDDDWDIVSKTGVALDRATAMKYPIGRHDDNTTRYAFLCRKPKRFEVEDLAEEAARVAQLQRSALNGKPQGVDLEEAYEPKGGYTAR